MERRRPLRSIFDHRPGEIAHALAVAGLHEIEELVADEISPLPADSPAHGSHSNGASNGTSEIAPPRRVPNAGSGKAEAENGARHRDPVPRLNGPSRPLMLVFKIKSSGLAFQAFWIDADGKTRHPGAGAGRPRLERQRP